MRALAGIWKAQEYRVKLSGDLDTSVWGADAYRIRNVELAIEPDGDGILKIFTLVVDSRGRTKPYSASVIEARVSVGAPEQTFGRVQPKVIVVSAEERFLDESAIGG